MPDLFETEKRVGCINENRIRINLLDEKRITGVQYGLNWAFEPETGELRIEKGKSESNRSGNEAYFQLPKEVYESDFFPENRDFHIVDDLGNDFVFSRSQPKVKDGKPQALSTPESNKILGLYIRHRLGLKSGSLIKKEHLIAYGRTDIEFLKKSDSFFMNFSNKSAASAQHSSQIQHKQLILYGVPGCGKSYAVAKKLAELGISQENTPFYTKRVVFHPEYTNADFVGQILPRADSDGNRISYPFVAGPFTQLLALAYTHKDKNFALIIEEINRGNAAAIFGELFQLLDRLEQDEGGSSNGYSYTAGWSSYPVANDSINRAVYEAYSQYAGDSDFAPFIPKENFERYKENIGIRLPPNFSIFATMNTSDQNVFKLDNAFKRRFDLELIPNSFDDENKNLAAGEKILVKNQRDAQVEGFDFTWNEFREAVNEIIASPENSFDSSSFADRQIGCWFAKAEEKTGSDTDIKSELKISKKTFVNKVLEYLWDDACGGESELFFSPQYKTLAELARAVEKNGEKTIFSSDLQAKIDLRKNAEQ